MLLFSDILRLKTMEMSRQKETVKCKAEERPLSPVEVMYVKFGSSNPPFSNYFHVNVIHSEKAILEHQIRKSFHEISKLHVLLQAKCVLSDTGDYLFQRVPQYSEDSKWINIQSINISSKDEWVSVVTEDLKSPFAVSQGPLWRVLWLTVCNEEEGFEYVLVFISCHAIIDVKSCMDLIHVQFLPLLNDLLMGNDFQHVHGNKIMLAYPGEKVFLNGIDETNYSFMKFETPWYIKAPLDFGLWLQRKGLFTGESKPKCREYDEVNLSNSVCHHPFSIERTHSEKFRQLCKKNSVSVHGVLVALLANAFYNAAREFSLFVFDGTISFPVDWRKFNKELSTSPLPLGVYTGFSKVKCQEKNIIDKKTFFEYCKKLTSEIKKKNKPERSALLGSIFNYLFKNVGTEDFIKHFTSVSLSNAGNFSHSPQANGAAIIQEQYFSVSLCYGATFITTLTYNGTMFFCVGFDCKWFSRNVFQFIVNDLRKSIDFLVSN